MTVTCVVRTVGGRAHMSIKSKYCKNKKEMMPSIYKLCLYIEYWYSTVAIKIIQTDRLVVSSLKIFIWTNTKVISTWTSIDLRTYSTHTHTNIHTHTQHTYILVYIKMQLRAWTYRIITIYEPTQGFLSARLCILLYVLLIGMLPNSCIGTCTNT